MPNNKYRALFYLWLMITFCVLVGFWIGDQEMQLLWQGSWFGTGVIITIAELLDPEWDNS